MHEASATEVQRTWRGWKGRQHAARQAQVPSHVKRTCHTPDELRFGKQAAVVGLVLFFFYVEGARPLHPFAKITARAPKSPSKETLCSRTLHHRSPRGIDVQSSNEYHAPPVNHATTHIEDAYLFLKHSFWMETQNHSLIKH